MVTFLRHQRSQDQSDGRARLGLLVLVLTFFVLPYVVDIPYLDDQTPNPDAEENLKLDRKAESKHNEIVPILADSQNDCLAGHGLTLQEIYKWISSPCRRTPSLQNIVHPSLISRPPPIA